MAKRKIKQIDKTKKYLERVNSEYDVIVITLENKNQIPKYLLCKSGDKDVFRDFELDFMNYGFGCMEGGYIYFNGTGCRMHFSPEAITKSLGDDEKARTKKLVDIWNNSPIAIDGYTIEENKIFLLMNYRNKGQRHDFYAEWKKYRRYQHYDMHGDLVFKHNSDRKEVSYGKDMVEFIDKNSLVKMEKK